MSVTPVPRTVIDAGDPAHALLLAVVAMQKQSVKELSALVTKLSDDIAASAVLAEKAARAKAEVVIGQAAEWSSAQIRDAGQATRDALTIDRSMMGAQLSDAYSAFQRLTVVTLILNMAMTAVLLVSALWK